MAEEYIIGNNAQFNDSVEILKDLTLYGVVENSTDFAVKIQGDEKLRITSDNFSFKIQGNDKLNIGNDNISFKTGFNIKIPNSYDVDDDGDIDVRDALYFGRGQFPSSVAIENSVQNAGIFFGDGDILRETTNSPQSSGSFALFTRNSTYDYADNFVSGTPLGGIRVGYSTAGTAGGSQGFSIIATKHDGNGTPVTMLEMGSDNLIFSGKVLRKGHTTNVGQIETQLAPSTQLYGNDRRGGIRIADFSDSPFPASLQFVKSRAGTVGVNTILQDGDRMGSIYWGGANGTNYQPAAFITGKTDGTVSSTSMPGAITFGTNAGDDLRDRIKIDPNGNFNIGVHDSTNPFTYLRFGASLHGAADIRPTNEASHKVGLAFYVDGTQDTTINPTEQLRITSSGNLQFNSGFGSVQTAYGVRAWALWNGETNTLLDDGNIAGFTDEGTGTYTFTFDNNMPDSNYVITGSTGRNAKPHFSLNSNIRNASNFRISTGTWGSSYTAVDVDSAMFCVIC